jgi:hypothetical protein
MTRNFFARVLVACVLGSAAWGQAVREPDLFFPIAEGNAWVFREISGEPGQTRFELIVLSRRGDIADLRWQLYDPDIPLFAGYLNPPIDFRLWVEGNTIDIETQDEGFQPFYHFEQEKFLHRDFDICNDGVDAVILPLDGTVMTPLGTFAGCLYVGMRTRCSHAGRTAEHFCPGIGLVLWRHGGGSTFAVETLRVRDKPFRRADANEDGLVDMSDAISVFSVLFRGEGYFACRDSADANDDGNIDISDGIYLLNFLFRGGEDLPPPGRETCDLDPSEDDVSCASYLGCGGRR